MGHREDKRLRTRARIQREAGRLLLQHGYDATTLPAIAAAADLAPRTVFSYFDSKDAIFLADAPDKLAALIDQVASCSDRDPAVVVASIFRAGADFGVARPLYDTPDPTALMLAVARTPQLAGGLLVEAAGVLERLADAVARHCDIAADDALALIGAASGLLGGLLIGAARDGLTVAAIEAALDRTVAALPALSRAMPR